MSPNQNITFASRAQLHLSTLHAMIDPTHPIHHSLTSPSISLISLPSHLSNLSTQSSSILNPHGPIPKSTLIRTLEQKNDRRINLLSSFSSPLFPPKPLPSIAAAKTQPTPFVITQTPHITSSMQQLPPPDEWIAHFSSLFPLPR
ncbi:hypothetical protein HDV57DRAFT_494230 [Trichoderma longibrachiatum]|uniref:Uncharacterized protein n=1 Tax=Trichoderma longibrachiatum ATCC 18648 TaxID=983965 RepID=A0A2T4CGQ8_TRILO|nr:hypothetical protein M440DRAFT_1398113 [Trichoderma longibrachiatum ATCC 18648]